MRGSSASLTGLIVLALLVCRAPALGQCVVFEDPADMFRVADAVFIGTVRQTEPTGDVGAHIVMHRASFAIETIWKGDVKTLEMVGTVEAFQPGKRYLVFAGASPETSRSTGDGLRTSLECGWAEIEDARSPKLRWILERVGKGSAPLPAGDRTPSYPRPPSRKMSDGTEWSTRNLNVDIDGSYCYDDAESNCRRYGRLYTWEAAQRACRSLGGQWRLPTDDQWRQLAKAYGGVSSESPDAGHAAYEALILGGRSGFAAVLGGGRSPDGREYARLEAHGFYWTASENGTPTAPFYNFGRGGAALHRQSDGEKARAFSVRCVRK
jgi:uncharacterized protein (TIGR02145 family)